MASEATPPTMKLAEILSDLVSLRVCDPNAALALVSTRPNATPSSSTSSHPTETQGQAEEPDADIKRAKELVELHYAVKEAHRRGELGGGLAEARASVERAVG